MPCRTCGFDARSLASAMNSRCSPCCRERAFEVITGALHELAPRVCRRVSEDVAEDLAQTIAARLSRHPVVEPVACDAAASTYLRRSLERAEVDELERQRPELLEDYAPTGHADVADERDLERELPRTDPSLVAWALADRLEAELEPVSRGVRGAAARAKFLRVFRGLLRLHLRRTSSRAALRAELGLATDNALEAAQCLARGRMERHLLRLLEVTSDADRRAELQELLRVTRRLRLR